MIFKPRYNNNRILVYKPEMKGTGIGSVLLDGGIGGQSSYSSVQDYKQTTSKGRGLEGLGSNALGEKLSKLVIKQPSSKKQQNIKFNL
jgi:hypothetical protein